MEVSNATDTAPAGWQTDNWGTNTASFTYATNNGHTGNDSAKVQITKYTSGDAKWYFTPVAVQPNMQYTFSDYYESTIATSLVVRFDDGSGNYTYVEPTDPASASAWTQATTTFTTPSTAKYVTVLHLIAGVGTLQTDDASLVAAATSLPQVSITGPTSDATVSGSAVTLSAAAIDSTGIASVQFQVDGANVGQAVTNSPYQYVWDSSTVGNGTHSITAVATSTDGQSATSTSVGVQVSNAAQTNGNVVPNPTLNIVNPSDSTEPDSWWPVTWGTNTTSFSYLKTGDNDTNSLKVQTTAYTSGASEWMFASQQATPDTQYKFSDYYKSNIPSEIEIEFNMSDGTQLYQQLGLPQKSTSWTQFTTVFNAPIGTESFSVYQFIQEVGYVTTDDYSITPYTPIGFNEPLVTLTFDDGYASTFENGLPLLQKYGFTSTQFIITDEINGSDFMTPQNLQTMYQDGNEIASHTVTHDDMTQETSSQLKTELSQSQQQLTAWLGIPITDIAYPYGLYNSAALTATAKYYTAARGVEDGLNSKDVFNPYDLKVENVFTTTTTAQVADWVKQAQTTNTWLILVYHSVSPTPTDENNVTPTQLDSQLAVIKASGVKVENMNTAFSEVTSQL
jgi:peptidoglycan/xylan/chitin deacetylase (PgdA/CDA1 family)